MVYSRHVRLLLLIMATVFFLTSAPGQSPTAQDQQNATVVTVRWGVRPGVSRYRLQFAMDSQFADIVFDRVVSGQEYRVSDLSPGRYFWRVAVLGPRLEFSSAGVIEVRADANPVTSRNLNTSTVKARSGWLAAIGTITDPVLANLRSSTTSDVVAANSEGRVFALDASRGIALWSARISQEKLAAPPPLPLRARNGLDNVLAFSANLATLLNGSTGSQMWRSTLPSVTNSAVAMNAKVFVLDNSLQKVFIIDGADGKLLAQAQLPRRVAGATADLEKSEVMYALDDGRLVNVDQTGKLTRSADAGSPATTAPIFVRSARGGLVLVGTKNGLTALSAADLRPLGRVALPNDAPRGALSARDLDGDGVAEAVMFTDRGRVVVIKSDEGKVLWEGDARQATSVAFADVNNDRVLDLLLAGREGFAFALSGRDGQMIWEESASSGVATNHAPLPAPRSAQVASSPAGVLLIAGDPRGGLRAVEFSKTSSPPR